MKTKTFLTIAVLLAVPAFASIVINTLVSFFYWQDFSTAEISKLNHSFMFWFGISGMVSISVIVTAILSLGKHSNNIDSLEEARQYYIKATDEMENARDKYTELLKKQ